MNKIQYFDIDTVSNDKRNIKGFILDNKIKLILISDPDINMSSCSVAIGAGHLQDNFEGTAHFLEHLLFMGSEKYPEQNEYHSYIQVNGGNDNAFTGDNITCYYISLETTFLKKGIEMLSWFFRAPLLDEKHISSEMEIINSEHQKNILMDNWIMDDIFKNFIMNEPKSKYVKFGTGNNESLKNITKNDIMQYYNKYYTTDNMYVCIVDSKNLNDMIDNYIGYFNDIPTKISNDSNRFIKEKINLIPNNLIVFKSSSEYLFINFHLIIDAIEKDLQDYQLVILLNNLITCEYTKSLGFYLKENNYIKDLFSNIDYFYDYQAHINIQTILTDKDIDKFNQICYSTINYINNLLNLTENEFIDIYNNFKNTRFLNLLYDSNSDPIYVSNNTVENMIKGNLKESIIRNYLIPEYENITYVKFIEMIKYVQIKITTNINYYELNDSKYTKTKWYNSLYYINNIDFNKLTNKKFENFDYEVLNIIGIKNFSVKMNLQTEIIDKSKMPELIYKNDFIKQEIYLLETNKYNKPISNITIIRKNNCFLDPYNKIIVGIYIGLCDKILNYYLETMFGYKLSFSISVTKEYLIYNFYGINNIINNFISNIIKIIHPNILFQNTNINKYYETIIKDTIEVINNLKYNSPYIMCSKYVSYLFDNNLLPNEKLKYISKLSLNEFKEKINICLKYSYEYYLLIGINKFGYNHSSFNYDNNYYDYNNDNYIKGIIDMISIDPKNFLIIDNIKDINEKKINFIDYKIIPKFINPQEINNCIIRYWKISNIEFNSKLDILDIKTVKNIIRHRLISSFVAEILNEPLFDRIRTIDKLGYIVKSDYKTINNNNKIYFIILFLVQSSYSINKVSDSISNFNDYIFEDLKNNYGNYLEKFKLLKKSKLLQLEKPFSDLSEEISTYIETIITKIFDFNLNDLFYNVCKTIDFSNDIEPIINCVVKKNSTYHNIILDKLLKKID